MQKLAIVGTHPATRENAPFDDPSYDIWVFNEAPQMPWCRRWDACFQLHKPEVYTSPNNVKDITHFEWLQRDHGASKVIWMQDVDWRVPNSRRYPMDEMRQAFPATVPVGQLYFTSTVAMAIALALHLGYEQIDLHGIDLSSGTEYQYQQMGFVYWAGVAKALLGDGFRILSGTQHFIDRVYGYEGETQLGQEYFQARVDTLTPELELQTAQFQRLIGKVKESILDFNPRRFAELIVECQDAAQRAGETKGALQEARMYAARTDPISRQHFEKRGAQFQEDGDKSRTAMDKQSGIVEYVYNTWASTKDIRARDQLMMFASKLLELTSQTGGYLGMWHETARYMIEFDQRVKAAGGERTLTALGVMTNGSN